MITFDKVKNVDGCNTVNVNRKFKDVKEIERNIITKYRSVLWTPFMKGVNEYEMIDEGDKIAVCISGGKDSLLLVKLLQELQKHGKKSFELVFIAMNPGFLEANYNILTTSCKNLEIDVHIFDTQIFDIVEEISKDYPCYMCARMRRGALYDEAQKLGCNKIALGHHYDDFIETTMLNIMYAGSFATMMPKLHATNYKGMQLIRPMVYVEEKEIIKYTKDSGIIAMNCGCVVAAEKTSSKRSEVKLIIEELEKINPDIKKSIFSSTKNVNIDTIIEWKHKNKKHSFLNNYNGEEKLR